MITTIKKTIIIIILELQKRNVKKLNIMLFKAIKWYHLYENINYFIYVVN